MARFHDLPQELIRVILRLASDHGSRRWTQWAELRSFARVHSSWTAEAQALMTRELDMVAGSKASTGAPRKSSSQYGPNDWSAERVSLRRLTHAPMMTLLGKACQGGIRKLELRSTTLHDELLRQPSLTGDPIYFCSHECLYSTL